MENQSRKSGTKNILTNWLTRDGSKSSSISTPELINSDLSIVPSFPNPSENINMFGIETIDNNYDKLPKSSNLVNNSSVKSNIFVFNSNLKNDSANNKSSNNNLDNISTHSHCNEINSYF